MQRLTEHISLIKAGRLQLPDNAGFVDDYIAEFTALKRTAFDQIDATTQYLDWIRGRAPLKPAAKPPLAIVSNRSGQQVIYR